MSMETAATKRLDGHVVQTKPQYGLQEDTKVGSCVMCRCLSIADSRLRSGAVRVEWFCRAGQDHSTVWIAIARRITFSGPVCLYISIQNGHNVWFRDKLRRVAGQVYVTTAPRINNQPDNNHPDSRVRSGFRKSWRVARTKVEQVTINLRCDMKV